MPACAASSSVRVISTRHHRRRPVLPKRGLSKAEVSYAYTGEVQGTGTLVYLIAYKADAAPVLGLEGSPTHGRRERRPTRQDPGPSSPSARRHARATVGSSSVACTAR
jgi:hypothetical protein